MNRARTQKTIAIPVLGCAAAVLPAGFVYRLAPATDASRRMPAPEELVRSTFYARRSASL